MAIHVLDRHTAELIAAGEVVERPASVVKELVENAIDAGAKNIMVEIAKGGTELIRVQDDGSGIAPEDIPLAFLRHATSKVATEKDLDAIHTLGFRGEALASVASVAKVELLTKTKEAEFASLYRIEGGSEIGLEAAARPVGTTFLVREIFYNTPARMKFLKKDASEATFVTEMVTRLALSHPEIAFRFVRDGKEVFFAPGDGKLESAVYALMGAQFAKELMAVEGEEKQYRVVGLITTPRAGRASRGMQFFFINGRFVKNRTMIAALEQAYRGMTMQGKFPGCVLFLQMPPELVDVNVHPAKTEVRFARESDVFDAVYRSVKATLAGDGQAHMPFPIHAQEEEQEKARTKTQIIVSQRDEIQEKQNKQGVSAVPGGVGKEKPSFLQKGQIKAYNQMVDALASTDTFAPYTTRKDAAVSMEAVAAEVPIIIPVDAAALADTAEQKKDILPFDDDVFKGQSSAQTEQIAIEGAVAEKSSLRLVGEVFRTYIVAEAGEVMCLIDKHAAHERMIYEELIKHRGNTDAQQLLSPVSVNLSAAEKNALLENGEVLEAAGMEVEDFGGNAVLVRSIPADVQVADVASLVEEVAQRLSVNGKDNLSEKTEWVYHSMACRAAIKAGDKTNDVELVHLAQEILSGRIPPFCPHGRPVVLEIMRKELEKQFGRLG